MSGWRPDRFSPTGLVRNLGSDADRSGIAELARRLPDGDAVLADAFSAAPTVLGFVLEPGAGEVRPPAGDFSCREAVANVIEDAANAR